MSKHHEVEGSTITVFNVAADSGVYWSRSQVLGKCNSTKSPQESHQSRRNLYNSNINKHG